MTNIWYPKGHVVVRGERHRTKAQRLVAMCGIRMAALYLKRRGYTAEQAVILLLK